MLTKNYKDILYISTKHHLVFKNDLFKADYWDKRELDHTELSIIDLILSGVRLDGIANALGCNEKTANFRLKKTLRYFRAEDPTDLMVWLIGEGYAVLRKPIDIKPPYKRPSWYQIMKATNSTMIYEKRTYRQTVMEYLDRFIWKNRPPMGVDSRLRPDEVKKMRPMLLPRNSKTKEG